jgi:hypothetical protein
MRHRLARDNIADDITKISVTTPIRLRTPDSSQHAFRYRVADSIHHLENLEESPKWLLEIAMPEGENGTWPLAGGYERSDREHYSRRGH